MPTLAELAFENFSSRRKQLTEQMEDAYVKSSVESHPVGFDSFEESLTLIEACFPYLDSYSAEQQELLKDFATTIHQLALEGIPITAANDNPHAFLKAKLRYYIKSENVVEQEKNTEHSARVRRVFYSYHPDEIKLSSIELASLSSASSTTAGLLGEKSPISLSLSPSLFEQENTFDQALIDSMPLVPASVGIGIGAQSGGASSVEQLEARLAKLGEGLDDLTTVADLERYLAELRKGLDDIIAPAKEVTDLERRFAKLKEPLVDFKPHDAKESGDPRLADAGYESDSDTDDLDDVLQASYGPIYPGLFRLPVTENVSVDKSSIPESRFSNIKERLASLRQRDDDQAKYLDDQVKELERRLQALYDDEQPYDPSKIDYTTQEGFDRLNNLRW